MQNNNSSNNSNPTTTTTSSNSSTHAGDAPRQHWSPPAPLTDAQIDERYPATKYTALEREHVRLNRDYWRLHDATEQAKRNHRPDILIADLEAARDKARTQMKANERQQADERHAARLAARLAELHQLIEQKEQAYKQLGDAARHKTQYGYRLTNDEIADLEYADKQRHLAYDQLSAEEERQKQATPTTWVLSYDVGEPSDN